MKNEINEERLYEISMQNDVSISKPLDTYEILTQRYFVIH